MATLFDIGGVSVPNVTPNINYGALAGIQPLRFGQGIKVEPLAPWQIPTAPQYIAQGISQAGSAIGKGILDREKSKADKEKQEAEKARWNEELGLKWYSENRRDSNDTERLNLEKRRVAIEEAKARMEGAGSSIVGDILGEGSSNAKKQSALEKSDPVVAGLTAANRPVTVGAPAGSGSASYTREATVPSKETAHLSPQGTRADEVKSQSEQLASGGSVLSINAPIQETQKLPKLPSYTKGSSALSIAAPIQQTEKLPEAWLGAPILDSANPSAALYTLPKFEVPASATAQPATAPTGRTLSSLAPQQTPQGAMSSPPERKRSPFFDQFKPGTMPRYGHFQNGPQGSLKSSQAAEEYAYQFNHGLGDPNWRAEGITPDAKGGYKIDYVNVADERKKAEESHQKLTQAQKEHVARITLQEGKAISTHPAFKNFESPNGLRPQTRVFLAAYNAADKNPKQAGAADIDMINAYIRATSGGKVTENEVHLLRDAVNWAEKFGNRVSRPLTGQALAPEQRDQMLRTMLEMQNDAAHASNEVLDTARERMIEGGQTNDIHLPHRYVDDLVLKSDADRQLADSTITYNKLKEEKNAAARTGNTEDIAMIDAEMRRIVESSKALKERIRKERFSGHKILGLNDFHTKRQGYVGGTGGILDTDAIQANQQK